LSKKRAVAETPTPDPLPPGSLRAHSWKRFLRGPDPELLEELYVPALGEAIRYDRCCAYFCSSALSAAARGFGRLIQRLTALGDAAPRPAIRLVVNEEMTAEDVRALLETGDTTKLEEHLRRRFKDPKDLLEKQRLEMLAWLAQSGLLAVRVGLMRKGAGVVHAKFGIITDEAGDAVVFNGSGNESARGFLGNYERLDLSTSWTDPEMYQEYSAEFEALWTDKHPDVYTLPLPEAVHQRLIKFAPKAPPIQEPSNTVARQKAAMVWQFIQAAPYLPNGGAACDATAMVEAWPHQQRVVAEVANAWPVGRLLCDEVGMGKTIEAILILRRLMAGRGVKRVLLLLPAGLVQQWQAELREKGGMVFPRLQGLGTLVWPDGRKQPVTGLAEALEQDVLLMSRETARTEGNREILLAAQPWDLVILDEAHAARRKRQVEGEFNQATLLLDLLRQLQLRRQVRGMLLLSATPMQTHPWEPWDLLAVLGEGGKWLADFAYVRGFYDAIHGLENNRLMPDQAKKAASLIAIDEEFPWPPEGQNANRAQANIERALRFGSSDQRQALARWLRQGSPLGRRMHRNSRATLQQCYENGLLPDPPPKRTVADEVFDYADPAERAAYDSLTEYIDRRFNQLEDEKRGKGFVMTVYRRRSSSSPRAIQESLQRRREGLRRIVGRMAYDTYLGDSDVPEALDADDLPEDESAGKVPSGLPSSPAAAAEELRVVDRLLEALSELGGVDTKRDVLFRVLHQLGDDSRPVLIFTQYCDTMQYLRDALGPHYRERMACYSGEGGQKWNGEQWVTATKDSIARALQNGELEIVLCTDAASEGLNLQAAGAVVNYDLPWNPSKVEQRIGRIDRIGQKFPVVKVVNLFLKDSVDDRVYRALRRRCGLFENFVGAMQPVLARARRMLTGEEPVDLDALDQTATEVEEDALTMETYADSGPEPPAESPGALGRKDIEKALSYLTPELGFKVRMQKTLDIWKVSGAGIRRIELADNAAALEANPKAIPMSPLGPWLDPLVESLSRPGEHLPLVVESYQDGAFRSCVARWVTSRRTTEVRCLDDLLACLTSWDGVYPPPDKWMRAKTKAQRSARRLVRESRGEAEERERQGLQWQIEAASIRLKRELGRYLICLGSGARNLNDFMYQQLSRAEFVGRRRLQQCQEILGGYPDWAEWLVEELDEFARKVNAGERRARIAGSELDAALQDPRWAATDSSQRVR